MVAKRPFELAPFPNAGGYMVQYVTKPNGIRYRADADLCELWEYTLALEAELAKSAKLQEPVKFPTEREPQRGKK